CSSPLRRCASSMTRVCLTAVCELYMYRRGVYPMTAVLQQVSDALASTVATVSPGIVRVEARRRLPASGLVWSRDGIIVTTHHVVEQDENIRVGLQSGQTVAAT